MEISKLTDFEQRVAGALNQLTSGVASPEEWLVEIFGGTTSQSGVRVNAATALGYPPVWYAVSKIARHIAMLPLQAMRRTEYWHEPDLQHPATVIFNRAPNTYQTPMQLREMLMLHALLNGNGAAWIERNQNLQPVRLWPLLPEYTWTFVYEGEKFHQVTIQPWAMPYPRNKPSVYYLEDAEVYHLPGLSYNGVVGIPLVSVLKDAIGLGLAGQQAAGSSFKNNGRPGLLLEAPPGKLDKTEDAKEFMANFNRDHAGLDNEGKTGLIRQGMKAHVLPRSAADSQFVEMRKLSRDDAALMFVLEQVLGEGASAYKSLTERNTAYIQNCLMPWACKMEQAGDMKLMSNRQKESGSHFMKMDMLQLARSDPNTWADYTGKLRQQQLISGDEGRKLHNMGPVGLTDYDNPNTSSGATQPTEEEPDEEPEATNAMVRRLVCARLKPILATEHRRLISAAKNKPNFVDWCEGFYAKFASTPLGAAIDELGADESRAEAYCEQSKSLLLDVLSTLPTTDLAGPIKNLVDGWAPRLNTLVDEICHDLQHVGTAEELQAV